MCPQLQMMQCVLFLMEMQSITCHEVSNHESLLKKLCMDLCVQMSVYLCVHEYACVCTYAFMHGEEGEGGGDVGECMCTCGSLCMNVCVHVCMHACACVCVCVCVCV